MESHNCSCSEGIWNIKEVPLSELTQSYQQSYNEFIENWCQNSQQTDSHFEPGLYCHIITDAYMHLRLRRMLIHRKETR